MKIYVDTDDDVRLARRIQRDVTQRGRDVGGALEGGGGVVLCKLRVAGAVGRVATSGVRSIPMFMSRSRVTGAVGRRCGVEAVLPTKAIDPLAGGRGQITSVSPHPT